jgi:hypothetical protein
MQRRAAFSYVVKALLPGSGLPGFAALRLLITWVFQNEADNVVVRMFKPEADTARQDRQAAGAPEQITSLLPGDRRVPQLLLGDVPRVRDRHIIGLAFGWFVQL